MLKLPVAVIDFEASGLSLSEWPEISSYPIEVGVAIAREDGSIDTWSSLIRPDPLWVAKGEWDKKAERVHGISREDLASGRSPCEVAKQLGSGLIDQSQKMTVAAMAMAEKKVWAQRS